MLHLNLLPRPPPAEPYHHLREQRGNDSEAGDTKLSLENVEESKSEDDVDVDERQSSSSSSEEEDPELVELLRENSEFSSSDEDKDHNPRHITKQGLQQSYRFIDTYDRPVNCIVVLIVACWAMRLPVMYKDFIE
jgi:RNA polymerase I-specific transcription initiation factor RRN7